MRLLLILTLCINTLFATHDLVFEELLQKVKTGYRSQNSEDIQREKRFLKEVQSQKKVVNELSTKLVSLKRTAKELKSTIETNEKKLQKLATNLDLATGDLGELFGTVKQISSDLKVHISDSIISATLKERKDFLKELTAQKELPTIQKLENVWYIMLQEIIEAGKVVKYKTDVIDAKGQQVTEEIIRLGNFNAFNDDAFLQFNAKKDIFVEPAFQPHGKYLSIINNFFEDDHKLSEVVLDPTRGTLLDLTSQKPTLQERIDQGGVIGYIILSIGCIGILFTLAKYVWLMIISLRIKKQLKNIKVPQLNNPLGRIINTFEKNHLLSISDLEYKVDEAFYKEVPVIQSGFSMIKLFAATAPLLGLLGTVTGMILTFQSITLFGTSDPKLMADGISQALITTMLGLSVAIPLLFAHTFLVSQAKKLVNILEQESIALVAQKME